MAASETQAMIRRLLMANAYSAGRYGSDTFPLGNPFEPIEELVSRAERWAEGRWQREHGPPPRPNPSVPGWY